MTGQRGRGGPVTLERAAREFADATALPPYLFDLGPVAGRAVGVGHHPRLRAAERAVGDSAARSALILATGVLRQPLGADR
jgi:hypothetical protein